MREPVGTRPTFAMVKLHTKTNVAGATSFKGVAVTQNGGALELLHQIKVALLTDLRQRFGNRGILGRLSWLDLRRWPKASRLPDYAVSDLEAIYKHWRARLTKRGITLECLKTEFEMIKVVFRTRAPDTGNSHLFWKSIICNKASFPNMHYFSAYGDCTDF